jgi:apoptotic chromatin condensation inducer in the nucleus
MLTYPMLNDHPIDKWMVTEKDELRQRNLPITCLKGDLVTRLFKAIQGEENIDGGTLPADGLKGGETPGSIDASVYEALGEANVDEGVCEVMKQGGGGGLVISVTESNNESLVPNTKAINEVAISTIEKGQRTLNDDTEVVPCSQVINSLISSVAYYTDKAS